jgi:hypothetical protein
MAAQSRFAPTSHSWQLARMVRNFTGKKSSPGNEHWTHPDRQKTTRRPQQHRYPGTKIKRNKKVIIIKV